jgi:hypothetical protein
MMMGVYVTLLTAPGSLAAQGHTFRHGRVDKPGYIRDLSQTYFIDTIYLLRGSGWVRLDTKYFLCWAYGTYGVEERCMGF